MEQYNQNRKVLYVDDEANLLSSFVSLLRKNNIQTRTLNDSNKIDAFLEAEGPFAVVFSDQRMPGLDGVGVLERVRTAHPDTIRVMVTGYAEHNDTLRAINIGGISSYISKPWNDDDLKQLVEDSIARYNLASENKFLLKRLDEENAKLDELLDGTVVGTVRILSDMLAYVNPQGAAQVARVRRLGNAALSLMPEISPTERWEIQRAFDLFNIGLAVLPGWVQVALQKDGLAGVANISIARNHHFLAARLVNDIPRFGQISAIIQLHRKHFDGSGEPLGVPIQGTDIPLGARLLHILTDLDRLSTGHVRGRALLVKMMTQPTKYDLSLLERIMSAPASTTDPMTEQSLAIPSLQPGMVLLDDILTSDGQLLLKAHSTLTETSINILGLWHRKDPILAVIRVLGARA